MKRKALAVCLVILIFVSCTSCTPNENSDNQYIVSSFRNDGKLKYTYFTVDANYNMTQVFDHQWDLAYDFQCGVGRVIEGKYWGLINTKGEYIIKPEWDWISEFDSESCLAKVTQGEKAGYINNKGEIILPLLWLDDKCEPFSEGLAPIEDPNGYKWGYMDAQGKLVIDFQWSEVDGFNEGLAPVYNWSYGEKREDDGWAYIDKTGTVKLGYYDWHDCTKFCRGIAYVCIDYPSEWPREKWGVINTKGEWIVEPYYHSKHGDILDINNPDQHTFLATRDDESLHFYLSGKNSDELYYSHSLSNEMNSEDEYGKLDINKPLVLTLHK